MEQAENDIVSSQKSLPPSQDAGWNDPPEWALSSQSNFCKPSTRRFLNKRVAFPLSPQASDTCKASSSSSSNMPPVSGSSLQITTAPHKPLMTPIDSITKDSMAKPLDLGFDKQQALTEILTNLESVMTEQRIEENKIEDIRKRLDTMKSDWLEGKLSDTIQKDILDICRALLRKDVEQANKIHVILMMQHATVCRTWMPAIRHIILELKKQCENCNVSQSEHSQSFLLPVETREK